MRALDPRVVEAVWQAVEPLIPIRPDPVHPLGCHRPRILNRECFVGILIRLVTGCSWDVAAKLSRPGETTLRNRRSEWIKAGVFDALADEAIASVGSDHGSGPVGGVDRRIGPQGPHGG